MPPTPSETNISFDLAWARQSLGLAIEGNEFDHRQTLRRLAEADFHAPPMLVEAAMIVSGKPPQGFIARRGEYIDFAGRAVDDFCKQFFKLAPDAREREFESVSKLAKIFPAHNERLRSLLPLLDVSAGSVAMRLETTAKELAKHLIRLATMSPTERAIERRQLVTTMLRDAHRWQAAAAEIETRAPEFMPLDPAFFRQVRSLSNREKAILAGKRRIVRAYKPVQPSVPQAAGGKSAGSRVAVVVLIIFCLSMTRHLVRSWPPSSSPSTSSSYSTPAFRPDTFTTNAFTPPAVTPDAGTSAMTPQQRQNDFAERFRKFNEAQQEKLRQDHQRALEDIQKSLSAMPRPSPEYPPARFQPQSSQELIDKMHRQMEDVPRNPPTGPPFSPPPVGQPFSPPSGFPHPSFPGGPNIPSPPSFNVAPRTP